MARTARYPWRHGTFRMAPAGLRESVLRVQCMDLTELRRMVSYPESTTERTPMLTTVAQWRLGQGCTRAQWNELVNRVGRVKYSKQLT